MKKNILSTVLMVIALMVTGCASNEADNKTISVVTREEGSGTRGAFVEIVGLYENKTDHTNVEAIVHDGTGKVMTAVQNDPNAIGYISLGSLNETVRCISIDGILPDSEKIKKGKYKVSRPFIITMKQNQSGITADFINYMISTQGQKIVNDSGYISVYEEGTPFKSTMLEGAIVIGGSTSVYPLMEKLAESYKIINPMATINIEAIGSTAGINGTADGMFDLGMVSRELHDEEKSNISHMEIALDGIAVIVNNQSPIKNLTMEQLKSIYRGDINNFNEIE